MVYREFEATRMVLPPTQLFITGPTRSGTSIVIRVVRALLGDGYHGFDEGHLLDLITTLDQGVDDFFYLNKSYYRMFDNMTVSHCDVSDLRKRLQEQIIELNFDLLGSTKIIDKTHGPDMVWALLALKERLPESRSIFLRRRFNEYLRSAIQKFPFWDFPTKLDHWWRTMDAWRIVRRRLGDYCLEIEHLDIVHRPEAVGAALVRHLRLPDTRVVDVVAFLRANAPEKTPGGTYDPVALEDLGLESEELGLARRRIRFLNDEFNYGEGVNYFKL